MTKKINLLKKSYSLILGTSILALGALIMSTPSANAAQLYRQLELGSTGSDVGTLQTYLAGDISIYPQGLVTNYFGFLTKSAVSNFQSKNGLPAVGRVGPLTLIAINNAMLGGGSNNSSWDTTPIMYSLEVKYTDNDATFDWNTNEAAQGQVFYDTKPLVVSEATGPQQQPYSSGTQVNGNSGKTNHQIKISNLAKNTTYYFMIRSVDNAGNVTMTWPSSFRTN